MAKARRLKHLFGGAMRQAGIVAAAGVYALDHHVALLADDHARARRLAEGWQAAGLPVDLDQVETNFVQLDVESLGLSKWEVISALKEAGVGVSNTVHPTRLRALDAPRRDRRGHRRGDRAGAGSPGGACLISSRGSSARLSPSTACRASAHASSSAARPCSSSRSASPTTARAARRRRKRSTASARSRRRSRLPRSWRSWTRARSGSTIRSASTSRPRATGR